MNEEFPWKFALNNCRDSFTENKIVTPTNLLTHKFILGTNKAQILAFCNVTDRHKNGYAMNMFNEV